MDNSMKLNYSNKKILEFNLNSIDDFSEIEIEKYDILKAFVTPNEINSKELVQNGFVFGDRTLDVSIPLTKIDGLEKFIRLPIIETSDYKNEILNIAQKCGFKDFSYFIKMFHRYKGMTPLKYRNMELKSNKISEAESTQKENKIC